MQSEIRKKVIDAFTNTEEEYLSGQFLADLIGCSRTAVWKNIEMLRKEGFDFEAVRKKGYKITKTPENLTADEVRFGLKTSFLGRNIHYEESVDSTQRIAHMLAHNEAEEGTVVIANEQISGKGRMGRVWHSPKSTGIWMSIILRPKIPLPKAPQLTLIAAVAVAQAIEETASVLPQIKWPNDILLSGKKVTGILTELQAEADRVNSVIIGIGMNVNQQLGDFPDEIKKIATSLSIETGETQQRATIIQAIFMNLERLYLLYLDKGFYPIKVLWESYATSIGKVITARTMNNTITGTALGISEDGVLLIESEDGQIHHIYSADIELP